MDGREPFNADAHRVSNFPLTGKHAFIPCQECHGEALGRTFTKTALACVTCHQADYVQTAVTSIDHAASGFGGACQTCHFTWRFSPARYDGHEACFQINGGPHGNVACRNCHLDIVGFRAGADCNTNNAVCTRCHRHNEDLMDQTHNNVLGYDYAHLKCYECHQFAQ